MRTQTRLEQYHNEQETERCTDAALLSAKYTGRNKIIREAADDWSEDYKTPVTVECYFAADDDVWYARVPATKNKPASDWIRANVANLKGLFEE
jgi:hypothetical protein